MGEEEAGEVRFVDTNIFLYVIQAHPEFGERSKEILERIDMGEEAITSLLNIAEICWWLEKHGKKDRIENDCVSLAVMKRFGVNTIYSNDRDFDKTWAIRMF